MNDNTSNDHHGRNTRCAAGMTGSANQTMSAGVRHVPLMGGLRWRKVRAIAEKPQAERVRDRR